MSNPVPLHKKAACLSRHAAFEEFECLFKPRRGPENSVLVLQDFLGVAGDHQLLVGGDDQGADLGAPGGDLADIALGIAVLVGIDADAQPVHVVADLGADDVVMLADAAGEDQSVHAAHGGDVAAHQLLDLVSQHIDGQLGAAVALTGCLFHVAHIAGNTRDAQQARLLVQDLIQLVAGDIQGVLQVVDHRGVQVAAAGAHHQAGQRGHAHGGIHHAALVHSGDGRAVAQVAGDQLQAVDGLLQVLGSLVADVLVAGAVEAVAADAVPGVVLVGDGVHIGLRGHGAVEGGIKDSHLGHLGAKDLAGGLDAQDAGGVVQGSQGAQLTQGGNDFVGDQAAGLELLAAVDHPVTDGVDLVHALNALAGAGGHLLDDLVECLGVGGENGRGGGLVAVGVVGDHAALHADALAQALAQHLLAVHINQLILQGRRTTVDNQNFHLLRCLLFYFLPSEGRAPADLLTKKTTRARARMQRKSAVLSKPLRSICLHYIIEPASLQEKKTKKHREVRINKDFQKFAKQCYNALAIKDKSEKCFISRKNTVYSTQRINVLLKEIKIKYGLKSVKHISSHSLRKTFGRHIYEKAEGNGEMALIRLSELFNHSNIMVTKRYLGLRREEIMSCYDLLDF